MPTPFTTVDRRGTPLDTGDTIRILGISPDPDMDEDDLDMFMDMIGAHCEIERIDDEGVAWVAIWWNGCDGPLLTSVGLTPQQMEKILPP